MTSNPQWWRAVSNEATTNYWAGAAVASVWLTIASLLADHPWFPCATMAIFCVIITVWRTWREQ